MTRRYGEFTDEPYYKDGNLDNITVTVIGITQNDSWRCRRSTQLYRKNVTTLNNTKNDYEYHVEVAKNVVGNSQDQCGIRDYGRIPTINKQ